ncbi:MAG TPA: endonuclease/exonuclease/phosphatase family protein [Verrucomicrobiae bacterium]|nr:endonuclease/exonuclease/phosphatase family protein [Verrucomicrobiae bacterium]
MHLISAATLREPGLQRTFCPVPWNFKRVLGRAALLVWAILVGPSAPAQILMSGGTYSQDFDSLATNGAGIAWAENLTLAGWYASRSAAPQEVLDYAAATGSSTTGSLYSFGSSGSAERALGSLASGSQGHFAYGVRFVNDTGVDRTSFVVSYTGEQWRVANASVQTLGFSYQVGTFLTNADARNLQSWITFPALHFRSPTTNGIQALNGNQPTNRFAFINISLNGLVVPAGQELFLRWFDTEDAESDDGLGVDDLTVSFGQPVTNAPPPVGTNTAFSLLTYNLKGNGASDWSTNAPQVQAIGRQLMHLKPDIISFNEINNAERWQMTNWVTAFLPGYTLVVCPGTDGFIRNGVGSRFPIARWTNHLDGASLTNFGYDGTFTRDLLEAQIAVPGFAQPLHLFVAHLKSGTDNSNDAARRAAEASAVSNFFVTEFLITNPLHPYILAGDMNEDIAHPATGSRQPIQRLTSGTGLNLTTPLNPFTQVPLTFSIQSSAGLSRRYDYILPNTLLFSSILSSQVFRTDLLAPVPPDLNTDDSVVASDHLPVLMVFNNPFTQPFRVTSLTAADDSVSLTWESVPGQSYRVEASSILTNWTALADNLLATNYSLTVTTNLSVPTQFFRVKRMD